MTDHSDHAPSSIVVNQHISVSPVRRADKQAFVDHLNDKEIHQRTLQIPYPYREEDADRFLAIADAATQSHGHPAHFSIRDVRGECIGGIGFEGLLHGHRAEIGYWLAKPYWGRGIMTSAVRVLCAYAHREWQLVRVTAHVFEYNTASVRVLEKNGFVHEGSLRKHHKKGDMLMDSLLYALVK